MINKIKLIDRLKSWLVTLGIASVFGLAALGVNAANSYQKASAYEYHQDGTLEFFNNYLDINILCNYYVNQFIEGNYSVSHTFECYFETHYTAGQFAYITECIVEYPFNTSNIYYLNFQTDESLGVYFLQDIEDGLFYVDDSDGIDFAGYGFTTRPSYYDYQEIRNYALSYNYPQNSGNFVTALTSFMSLIGGGIVQLAQSIGAGVVSFASGLFLDSGHLSILGGIIGIFAGIALAVGITSKVYSWVSTLGN